MLEQPRKSKMRKLSEWIFLLEHLLAEEQWTASCAFGSIHLKEFVFLCTGLTSNMLHRKCSRDHDHVPIQGSYTKASAVYTDELAYTLAECFHRALKRKLREKSEQTPEVLGLETPLCNDLLVSGDWRVEQQWEWKVPAHINIQESASVYRLMKRGALVHPSSRFSIVMDSNVGLSAFVKGRSPSHGLRKVLRRTSAVAVAGCLYPAYHFGPTRLNIADCPTRDSELPSPCKSFSELLPAVRDLYAISNVGPLRRFASNWVRLFLLVYGGSLPWKEDQECWKFSHLSYSAMPFSSKPFLQRVSHSVDFDSSCGLPGEGPGFWTYALLLSHTFCLSPTSLSSSLISGIWISVSCAVGFGFNGARYPHKPQISFYWVMWSPLTLADGAVPVSHGSKMLGRDAKDRQRAEQRSGHVLTVGRPVLGQTQHYRDKLLDHFTGWLRLQGVSFEELVMTPVPDVEGINLLLEKYGRALFDAGRPYNHYAELTNSVAAKKPALRRNLQAAWDLAYTWLRLEPPIHHIALPWQALLSILTISVSWGWLRVAGVISQG